MTSSEQKLSKRGSRRAPLGLAVLLGAAALAGCGPTLIAVTSYRGHRAIEPDGLEAPARLLADGGADKAQVLAKLGPPVSILGQDDGEVFVYRRVARDTNTIDLNPSHLFPAAPPVPVYTDTDISGRDDLLMVFFDREGRVRAASIRHSIARVEESRAARLSEWIRGWFE